MGEDKIQGVFPMIELLKMRKNLQIVSKVGNMANGDVKTDGGTDVIFTGVKPTYIENLSRWARNEPG